MGFAHLLNVADITFNFPEIPARCWGDEKVGQTFDLIFRPWTFCIWSHVGNKVSKTNSCQQLRGYKTNMKPRLKFKSATSPCDNSLELTWPIWRKRIFSVFLSSYYGRDQKLKQKFLDMLCKFLLLLTDMKMHFFVLTYSHMADCIKIKLWFVGNTYLNFV